MGTQAQTRQFGGMQGPPAVNVKLIVNRVTMTLALAQPQGSAGERGSKKGAMAIIGIVGGYVSSAYETGSRLCTTCVPRPSTPGDGHCGPSIPVQFFPVPC